MRLHQRCDNDKDNYNDWYMIILVPSRERDANENWKISTAIKKGYLFNVFRMTSRA